MADDDKEPAPPPRPQQPQPPVWVPDQVWDTPYQQRNNVLYDTQPNFVPPPMEPPAVHVDDAKQARFDRLEARVAVLETTLLRPPGVGHNQGPDLHESLSVNEAGIQHLIALLKDQHATGPVDLAKLIEAAQIADPAINKWRERIDQFVNGVLKGSGFVAGKEIGEQLERAAWVHSVYSALQSVFEALMSWLQLF